MIMRVTVSLDFHLFECRLAGFGMTACGNCNKLLPSLYIGARCTGCGASIVVIERKGGTSFETEHV